MVKVPARIPDELHYWIDFGLSECPYDVIHNDDAMIGCTANYVTGNKLFAFITYATEEAIFSTKSYFVYAVCDLNDDMSIKKIHLKSELPVHLRQRGMVIQFEMRSRLTAMLRAVADVLGYGEGIPFERTKPVERTGSP